MPERKKKILFVIGQLGIGGAERQLVYLATHLDRSRYEVMVCSFSTNAQFSSLLEEAGVKTVILPQVMRPDLTRPFKLYRLVKTFQPDLIHAYLFVANTWSRIIGAILNTPVIISERSSNEKRPLYISAINRVLASFGTILIANSQAGASSVIARKEFPSNKVRVVYNGIPVEKFQKNFDESAKSRFRLELGIPDGYKVIGVIGRLDRSKNHELLFSAFQELPANGSNACILCIGDGPRREELKQITMNLGIADRVIFAGTRKDIPECLAIMDVLVLPSRWEGLPNVVLEAMAAKCPVVATNVGGVGELIMDGVTGWLTRPGDKCQLAEKIHFIMIHPDQVERITEQAYQFVKKNFSINHMVTETEKIYKTILSK